MSQKEAFPCSSKENSIEKESGFEKRIKELFAEGRNFPEIFNLFCGEGVVENGKLRYFNDYEDSATILGVAREKGVISKEISGHIIDLLRSNISDISPSNKPPDYKASKKGFIAELRKSAENDKGEIGKVMNNFSQIISPEIIDFNRQKIKGERIPENKENIIKEYRALDNKIFHLSIDFPIKLFLHFYDNGDLKWLWGIDDNDSFQDISKKSHGFRIADTQNINW